MIEYKYPDTDVDSDHFAFTSIARTHSIVIDVKMSDINSTTVDSPFPPNFDRDTGIWYVELHPYLLLVGGSLFTFWFMFAGVGIPCFRLYTHIRLKYYPMPEDADRIATGTSRYIHTKHWGLTLFCYITAVSLVLALYISAAFEYEGEFVSPSEFADFIWYISHYWTWHPELRPSEFVFVLLYIFATIDILIPTLAGIFTLGQWTDENLQSTANKAISDDERQQLNLGESHQFSDSQVDTASDSDPSADSESVTQHSVKFSGSIDSGPLQELVPIEDELVHGFIVVCHNSSKDVIDTIRPILAHIEPWQLFLADNGSTQLECVRTQTVCDQATAEYREAHPDYDGPPINLSHLNKGNKTWAQYALVKEMSEFRYNAVAAGGELSSLAINCVTLLDDDVIWPSTWASHKCDKIFRDKTTVAIAYPLYAENGSATIWTRFQEHEYLMGDAGVNRFLQDTMGTNLFCSGAAATWRLEVLMEVLLRHDTTFNGEDLEMGYITHRLSGRDKKLLATASYLPTFNSETQKPEKEFAVVSDPRDQEIIDIDIEDDEEFVDPRIIGGSTGDLLGLETLSEATETESDTPVSSDANAQSCNFSNMSALNVSAMQVSTQITEKEFKKRQREARLVTRDAHRGHKIAVMRECFVPTIVPFCFLHFWDLLPNPVTRKYFPNRKCGRDCGEASLVAQRFRSWEVGNHSFTWRFVKLLISPGGFASRAKWVARLITLWRLISIGREYLYIIVMLYTAIFIPSWFGSMMILTIDMTIIYLGLLYTAQMWLNYMCLRKPHMQTRTETTIAFPWIFSLPYLILIRPLFIAYFICYYFSFVRWPTEIRKAIIHDAKLNKEIDSTWDLGRSMSDYVRSPGDSMSGSASGFSFEDFRNFTGMRNSISNDSIFGHNIGPTTVAANTLQRANTNPNIRDSAFGSTSTAFGSGSSGSIATGSHTPTGTTRFFEKHYRPRSYLSNNESTINSAIYFHHPQDASDDEHSTSDVQERSYSYSSRQEQTYSDERERSGSDEHDYDRSYYSEGDEDVVSGDEGSPERVLTHRDAHIQMLQQHARGFGTVCSV